LKDYNPYVYHKTKDNQNNYDADYM